MNELSNNTEGELDPREDIGSQYELLIAPPHVFLVEAKAVDWNNFLKGRLGAKGSGDKIPRPSGTYTKEKMMNGLHRTLVQAHQITIKQEIR